MAFIEAVDERDPEKVVALNEGVVSSSGSGAAGEADTFTYTREEERKVLWKLDWNLTLLLGSVYLMSYLDRGNIGNAETAGMGKDLGLDSNEYAWVVQMYYVAYICFQWTILLWTFFKSLRTFVALATLGFGVMSMLQAAATSFSSMMAIRFILGVFEACYAPGVALYLSFFYHRREMGLRYGLFISFSALASCFASALAYAIVHAKAALADWKLLFLIEGSPTILLAVVVFFRLPDGPGSCPAIKARGVTEGEKRHFNLKEALKAFLDYKAYTQAAIIFCLNTSFASLPVFLPTIVNDMGFSSIRAQGLSAPPYLGAYFACLLSAFLSDRLRLRGPVIASLCVLGGVSYMVLFASTATPTRYAMIYTAAAGIFPATALAFAWVTDNGVSASRRGASLAIFGCVGQGGSLFSGRIYPSSEGPYYRKGMAICGGLMLLAAVLALGLSGALGWQNRRKDKRFGRVARDAVPDEVVEFGEEHPGYRFVL